MKLRTLTSVALLATAVGFANANTSVEVPLSGTLPKACGVTAFLDGPFDALDMTDTDVQGSESMSVTCNYGGSASVTFESANLGKMVSDGNEVPYKLLISGSPFSTGVSLASPQTWAGWPAVTNAVQTRSLKVQLDMPAVVAGDYTDTITATVVPN
ncbi:spore coat protein U domain-containing protein [Marinobacter sp. X15-166B]|uniref:spore coat protein U domain-containing protein n=1 Tax=Marinobacter sp. X15-166B TaxID=1897620 RepID=UPI000945A754|nr:spore coat protein U domain-containing protein [Marinobacter sp. X15-166B]